MAPLACDPAALDSAGAGVLTAGEGLGSVISTLAAALSGCAGMAGDDPVGAALGHSYDNSAAKLIEAMVATRNGLCSLGDGVRISQTPVHRTAQAAGRTAAGTQGAGAREPRACATGQTGARARQWSAAAQPNRVQATGRREASRRRAAQTCRGPTGVRWHATGPRAGRAGAAPPSETARARSPSGLTCRQPNRTSSQFRVCGTAGRRCIAPTHRAGRRTPGRSAPSFGDPPRGGEPPVHPPESHPPHGGSPHPPGDAGPCSEVLGSAKGIEQG
jgi:hypothetical protein